MTHAGDCEKETISARDRAQFFYAHDVRCQPHGRSVIVVRLLLYEYCSYPRDLRNNELTTLPLNFFDGLEALVDL